MAITKKTAVEAEAVKTAAPVAAVKEETPAKKTRAARKTAEPKAEKKPAGRKPKAAKEELVFIEINQRQAKPEELVARAKADWIANGNKEADLNGIRVYVNTNEGMVYYVVNDSSAGSFEF